MSDKINNDNKQNLNEQNRINQFNKNNLNDISIFDTNDNDDDITLDEFAIIVQILIKQKYKQIIK